MGVRYVLEGSVRRASDRVRVSAKLIEAASGAHVWADRFDRDLEDIFELQDDITQTIAATLEPELAASERQRVGRKPTSEREAWELVLNGVAMVHQSSRESLQAASDLFKRALTLDPNFGRAHAYLAHVANRLAFLGWAVNREETIRHGIKHAGTAISIDPNDYVAHASLGYLLLLQGNHKAAIEELETLM